MYSRLFSFFSKQEEKHAKMPAIDQKKLEELASIAQFIYHPDDYRALPNGWYVYMPFYPDAWEQSRGPSYGYMGAIVMRFADDGNRPAEIVIVSRGTVLNEFDNLLGDLEVAMNMVPMQVQVAATWIDEELNRWRKRPDGYGDTVDKVPTWHIGHSLGSVIANCTYSREYPNHMTQPGRIQCVGFENPGVKNIVNDYLVSTLKLSESDAAERMDKLGVFTHSYQTDVNIINTCNEQWGNVNYLKIPYRYTLTQYPNLPAPSDEIASSYLANPYYIKTYSFSDQHEMTNLLNYIKQNIEIVDAKDRKYGFANGYSQYLDGEKRKDYWLGYFQIVWDNNDEIRRVFHNKYDEFTKFMFNELNDMRSTVLLQGKNIEPGKKQALSNKNVSTLHFSQQIDSADKTDDDFVLVQDEEKSQNTIR
jgi:hypothetical protein